LREKQHRPTGWLDFGLGKGTARPLWLPPLEVTVRANRLPMPLSRESGSVGLHGKRHFSR
jgi:hypothetical protein